MTAMAVPERLRQAVLTLPLDLRYRHLTALACLLHLLEHVSEGCEPLRFVCGRNATLFAELHWAAQQLGHEIATCSDQTCPEPEHVTIETRPVAVAREMR